MDFSTLYKKHFLHVHKIIYKRIDNWDIAEELAQEVFFRFMFQTNVEKPLHWLLKTASNIAKDEIRRTVIRRRLEEKYGDEINMDRITLQPAYNDLLPLSLKQLTLNDQTLLNLWSNGYDYDEISNETGLNKKSVGTSLKRARDRFREKYLALDK